MKYIRTFSTITAATGIGALLSSGLTGCTQQQNQQDQQPQAKGAFVIIEETAPGRYKIKDEFPADETRIVLKRLDSTERVLTKEEMDALVAQEAARIDAGQSNLTRPDAQEQIQQQGGMGLGETILASAAGYMLGAWIGSKLFGNQNYQNNRKAGYKSPQTYSRSKSSFSKPRKSMSARKSGFFGSKKTSGKSGFFKSRGFFGG
ncbi:MAG: hypothetical protein DSZ10_04790 [Sulfurovum sp.]|nr:MAG: hypothetical protein DSZ10_04790 [Sulfurovum sp.]